MINFTNCEEEFNNYKGSEKKKTLIYNNKKYLVKFPDPIRQKAKEISYINNAFSEYVGSKIFQSIGFKTQETVLGYYNYNGKQKIVCACEDFTDEEHNLYEFENLALSTNPDKKIETDIEDIEEVLNESSKLINTDITREYFWDMFIVDALIGNTDRHNGNWGFLINKNSKEIVMAPVYDCGSCLNPLYSDEELEKLPEKEIKNLALNCYSCLKENKTKINYSTFIQNMKNQECNNALLRVFPKINIEEIKKIIDEIECMSDLRKEFYKNIIIERYEKILLSTYNKIIKSIHKM